MHSLDMYFVRGLLSSSLDVTSCFSVYITHTERVGCAFVPRRIEATCQKAEIKLHKWFFVTVCPVL